MSTRVKQVSMTRIEGASASTVSAATISSTVETPAGAGLPVNVTPGKGEPGASGACLRRHRYSEEKARVTGFPRRAAAAKLTGDGGRRRALPIDPAGAPSSRRWARREAPGSLCGDGDEQRRRAHLDEAELAAPRCVRGHADRTSALGRSRRRAAGA